MSSPRPASFSVFAALPVSVLLAAMSLGGLLLPGAYARETPEWVGQAIGQDWFDLLIAAPAIALCGLGARTGSYRWKVLLAGAYAYTVYELFIYAFAIHFNALFLVYCATLGFAAFALIGLLAELARTPVHVDRRGAHLAGGFLIFLGAAFGALWLLEDLPAALANEPSPTLVATGLFTNPVHVIDLSFILPAHVVTGVLLWRGRPRGELYGPVILAFGVLMSASIGGMMVVIALRGGEAALPVTIAMFAVTSITAAMLWRALRGARIDGAGIETIDPRESGAVPV